MKEINYPGLPTPKEFLEGKDLNGTLGEAEAEEMFQLILQFSLDANKWVAPDFDEICEAIKKKQEAINKKNEEVKRRNATKKFLYEMKKKLSWFYRLIGKKLVEPEYEKVVDSVMITNPKTPVVGLKFMKLNGYLQFEDGPQRTHYAILTLRALDTLRK